MVDGVEVVQTVSAGGEVDGQVGEDFDLVDGVFASGCMEGISEVVG